MNQPLGGAVGNALEMIEAIDMLRGGSPADYREHCYHLAAHVLVAGQRAKTLEEGRAMAEKSITDGSALETLRVLVQAQGGDVSCVDDVSKFERAKFVEVVNAPRNGFISQVHARIVGEASVALGAGRAKKSDSVDHAVGFIIHKKVGDQVREGEPLFEIHSNDKAKLDEARKAVLSAYQFSDEFVPPLPLFYE
jgi:pyrimidine-nucleoside phosphorylase